SKRVAAPGSLLRQRDFALYLVVNLARVGATQIVAVGVGWQVYAIHRNPFDLGLVGLAEFVPLPLLALPAGQLADRFSRRLVPALCALALACTLALHRRGGWVPGREVPPDLAHVLGGISFLRRSRVVLGAILLDLFAVLFGGAVALLPVFARSILHTGPAGLG